MKKWLLFLFILGIYSFAHAGTVKEYSAEMVDVAQKTVMQKIYVSADKIRIETPKSKDEPESGLFILRMDKSKGYVIMPEDKVYLEFDIDKNADVNETMKKMIPLNIKIDMKEEKMGSETVNGYKAQKSKITSNVEFMGKKSTSVMYRWMAKEFDPIPVRTMNEEDNLTAELVNVKKGAQASGLFEIPAGYQKQGSLSDMFKGMPIQNQDENTDTPAKKDERNDAGGSEGTKDALKNTLKKLF